MVDTKKLIDDAGCSVCKAEFHKTDLDEHGRCPLCVSNNLMPGLKEDQDFVKQDKSVSRKEIEEIVREVLAKIEQEKQELAAESDGKFTTQICKVCGKEFTPRAPAQKRCQDCIDEAKK